MPSPPHFPDVDQYTDSMLSFISSSEFFQHLCGGVHILDFITREPELYTALLPGDWRQFFASHNVSDILDLLMREDMTPLGQSNSPSDAASQNSRWHNGPIPPSSLLEYIRNIRHHSLNRVSHRSKNNDMSKTGPALARHIAVGMNAKKVHEVSNLASYVDNLSSELSSKHSCQINHLVDFGSGQNYLGRALASPPYNHRVIALESKPLNIEGARSMDVTAKLAEKDVIMRNKKEYRSELYGNSYVPKSLNTASSSPSTFEAPAGDAETSGRVGGGNIQYIETSISDGDLSTVLSQSDHLSQPSIHQPPNLMVISLHSCGNLLHHGLRSLILNPSVRAVALVGCCYNLLTERLPHIPQSQSAQFRPRNVRLTQTSSTCDPHGFPMSNRFMKYKHASGEGVRFNITARMMAVQAPYNWTAADCDSFFTRHFYRALFQRILLDKGVIEDPDTPVILGSLRKPAYTSFLAYTRAAIAKLVAPSSPHSSLVGQDLWDLTDEEILAYEDRYAHKKKEISIVWSLMAFSAQVVESAIVVDRWLWLKEQEEVKEAWVEAVFDYAISPRNLIVVGVKG